MIERKGKILYAIGSIINDENGNGIVIDNNNQSSYPHPINKTYEELLSSKDNLSGADLSGADLSNIDLTLTNLSGANLRVAKLLNANLSYVDLIDAKL